MHLVIEVECVDGSEKCLLITCSSRNSGCSSLLWKKLYGGNRNVFLVICAEHRDWPGFESPLLYKNDDSIWERSSPSPPQPWPGFIGSGHQPYNSKGPAVQQPQSFSNLWSNGLATTTAWNNSDAVTGYWNPDPTGVVGLAPTRAAASDYAAVDDGGSTIFDPFNSLDTNRIWNPNTSDTSSGVSGWLLGMAGQRPDSN